MTVQRYKLGLAIFELLKSDVNDLEKRYGFKKVIVYEDDLLDMGAIPLPEDEGVEDNSYTGNNTQERCTHCGELVCLRNPSGYCDHLYYPENCELCKSTPEIELPTIAQLEADDETFKVNLVNWMRQVTNHLNQKGK